MASHPIERFVNRDINRVLGILGTTQPHLWLFSAGPNDATSLVPCMGTAQVQYDTSDEAAVRNINAEFSPLLLPCGLYGYHFQLVGNQHIAASADSAQHSFGNATVDSPFSVGAWVAPASRATSLAIMSKYDAGVGVAREWRWTLDTSGFSVFELYDESADTTEIGTSTTAVALMKWSFVTVTYDGGETAPVVKHYINGALVGPTSGATTEVVDYVAMENTATPLIIGATGLTSLPAQEFHGYMALPFLTGKELTAAEVTELYEITQRMVMG